jgi:predicted acetyltransferase
MAEKHLPEVNLALVPQTQKHTLANLMQLYRYDSSLYNADEIDASGSFSLGQYFDAYWAEPERHPFFVKLGDKLAGFALVRQFEPGKHSVAEFFVMRPYRRQGVGQRAAAYLFDMFPGEWHVAQEEGNTPAQRFWRSVIAAYTDGDYLEGFSESQPRGPKQIFRSRASLRP